MSAYTTFAFYYDDLTRNVDYPARADYFCRLFSKLGHSPGLALDLACGTGSLTMELARRGLDIYGVDASPEMLSVAREKAAEAGLDLLFLCQKMQNIDLYGTVNTVICSLDSINHLVTEKDVLAAFKRVSLFLEPGGYFVFDMNTPYKHRAVLGNQVFVYDTDRVYCVWQNHYEEKNCRVAISLDFFSKDGNVYRRSSQHFFERAYEVSQMHSWLESAGFKLTAVYDDMSFSEPADSSQRVVMVCQKI